MKKCGLIIKDEYRGMWEETICPSVHKEWENSLRTSARIPSLWTGIRTQYF
jgi:hypothetical protein